jgi:nicotinamide riboside kinase
MRRKIAITGGPSGGKTTLIDTLQRDLGHQVASVPEAASILYRGGFPRRPGNKLQKHVQKAIYFTQFELESIFEEENPNKLIICDRGSVDGLAYWPESTDSFFKILETNLKKEYARYDWVLHLDTAPIDHYDVANPIRTETFTEAIEVNTRILKAWADHPQRIIVKNQQDFFSKMNLCLKIIRLILQDKTFSEINKLISSFDL